MTIKRFSIILISKLEFATGFSQMDGKSQTNEKPPRPYDQMNLEEIVHLTNKVGMEYVKAKKKSERFELLKPTYRAKAMERYDDGQRSEAKIKRMAEMDPEYIEFIEQLAAAKIECERLKIRYDSFKNLFEARRSLLSYRKAEMNLL